MEKTLEWNLENVSKGSNAPLIDKWIQDNKVYATDVEKKWLNIYLDTWDGNLATMQATETAPENVHSRSYQMRRKFQPFITEIQERVQKEVLDRIRDKQLKALCITEEIMNDPEVPVKTRLEASRDMLAYGNIAKKVQDHNISVSIGYQKFWQNLNIKPEDIFDKEISNATIIEDSTSDNKSAVAEG